MTADIQHQGRLTRCYREQALLPLGIFVGREIAGWHRSKLWEQSLLAMTAAHPTSRQTDTLLSRASFAPTGDFCWQGNRRLAPIQTVGAKLARDDGGHPTSRQTNTLLSRASFAPTGIYVGKKIAGWHRSKPWEQSLLAMTAAHPTSRQTDTPLSRASPHTGISCKLEPWIV